MAARNKLRAVAPDEKPPTSRQVKTVTQAADTGTMRDLLVAMRTRTAKAVEDPNTPARDLAALTRRLLEIAREIESIDAAVREESDENGTAPDEAFDASAV